MTIKHCVVHRNCVNIDAGIGGPKVEIVKKTIDDLIDSRDKNNLNILLFDKGNPERISDYFEKGDEVILYGAYLGMCLYTAERVLMEKGVKVFFHPEGCI